MPQSKPHFPTFRLASTAVSGSWFPCPPTAVARNRRGKHSGRIQAGWFHGGRSTLASGLTLLELLLVIAILGLLVGLAIPSSEPNIYDQLRSAASIVASDLDYARGLAVAHSSSYKVTFDIPNNRYVLTHTGSNPNLNKLPRSPFSGADASSDTFVVDLDELPLLGAGVRLVCLLSASGVYQPVDSIEFGPLGQTTHSDAVRLWLAAGANQATRYIWLEVNPVTGLVTIGQYTAIGPAPQIQPVGSFRAVVKLRNP